MTNTKAGRDTQEAEQLAAQPRGTCPVCKGEQSITGRALAPDGKVPRYADPITIECDECDGAGMVPDRYQEALRMGWRRDELERPEGDLPPARQAGRAGVTDALAQAWASPAQMLPNSYKRQAEMWKDRTHRLCADRARAQAEGDLPPDGRAWAQWLFKAGEFVGEAEAWLILRQPVTVRDRLSELRAHLAAMPQPAVNAKLLGSLNTCAGLLGDDYDLLDSKDDAHMAVRVQRVKEALLDARAAIAQAEGAAL